MFRLLTDRRLLLSAIVIGTLTAIALWPTAVAVDVAAVARGPLVVTVDEEGRTRVRDRFVVTAPVAGRVPCPGTPEVDLAASFTAIGDVGPTGAEDPPCSIDSSCFLLFRGTS